MNNKNNSKFEVICAKIDDKNKQTVTILLSLLVNLLFSLISLFFIVPFISASDLCKQYYYSFSIIFSISISIISPLIIEHMYGIGKSINYKKDILGSNPQGEEEKRKKEEIMKNFSNDPVNRYASRYIN